MGQGPGIGDAPDPASGPAEWKTLRSYRVGGNDVFNVKFSLSGSAVLRAVAGAHTSLTSPVR